MKKPDGWRDATRPLHARTPVWPGDPRPEIRLALSRSAGDPVNVTEFRLGAHTGTHLDMPFHLDDAGARLGQLDLDRVIGTASVIDVRGDASISPSAVDRARALGPVDRILFRTGCWQSDRFPDRFAGLHPEAAARLARLDPRLVGTDAPSIDPPDAQALPAHRMLLGAGIPILENLLLDDFPEGRYEMLALPLALVDSDAAPVRVLLRVP